MPAVATGRGFKPVRVFALKELKAEHLAEQMESTTSEGFAEKVLQAQGVGDVTKFLTGRGASRPQG